MRERIKQPVRGYAGDKALLRAPVPSWSVEGNEEAMAEPGPGLQRAPSIRRERDAGFGVNFGALRIHADSPTAGVVMRAPATGLDALVEKVGADIDAATAPETRRKRTKRQLDKATAKAKEDARHAAVLALADQVRSEVPDRAKLDALLDDASLSDEEKVDTIGEVIVQVARMEFLLGWMYYGGVTPPEPGKRKRKERRKWEEGGTDKGEFPDLYQKEVGTSSDGGSRWCTSFAGYAHGRLGLDSSLLTSRAMIFGSGIRLETWATKGQSNSGRQLTPADKTVTSVASGAFIGRGSDGWKSLTKALKASDTAAAGRAKKEKLSKDDAATLKAEGRAKAVADFLTAHGEPKPGDFVVVGENNEYITENEGTDKESGGHSHTTLVERYDAATATITTIEGNAGSAVASHKLVLTNPKDVARIVHLTRPGLEHYQRSTPAPTTPAAPATAQVDTRTELKSSVQAVIEKLVKLASDRDWILSDDADASVFEWLYGPDADDDAGAGMSTH